MASISAATAGRSPSRYRATGSRSGMPAYYAQYLLIDEFSYSSEIKGDLEDIRYKLERIAINIR